MRHGLIEPSYFKRTVWKFPTDVIIQVPERARVVHVGWLDGTHVWLEVNPDADRVSMRYVVVPTGGEVPDLMTHVGSTISPFGLVWHVYQEIR